MGSSVTRADVAAAAGTSTAVVSYVLNDGPRPVAAATRERVLAAVERLGYRPNALAAGLSARRTRLVGLVVPDLTLPFFAGITARLAAEAGRRGLTLLTTTSGWDAEREVAAVEEFVALRVRGLCLAPATGTPAAERAIRESGVPTVLLSGDRGELALPQVLGDAHGAGRLATRHLLDHGHADVACLTVPMGGVPVGPRVEGWRAELAASGAGGELWTAAFDRYATEPVAAAMLEAHPGPAAVVAATDEVALGVLAAAARTGRRVPEDCAVVGCDGIPEGLLTRPALTTVAEPVDRLCSAALDHLLAVADRDAAGEGGPADDHGVGPTYEAGELRLGGTCGCPPRARPAGGVAEQGPEQGIGRREEVHHGHPAGRP